LRFALAASVAAYHDTAAAAFGGGFTLRAQGLPPSVAAACGGGFTLRAQRMEEERFGSGWPRRSVRWSLVGRM